MKKEMKKWQELVQCENMDIDDDNKDEDNDDDHGGEGEAEAGDSDDFADSFRVLAIGISGMEASIWIRAEYIQIFDHITKVHDELVTSMEIDEVSYCVVLTGQPGILIWLSHLPINIESHRKKLCF